MFGFILKFLGGGILEKVLDKAGSFFGNKEKRDEAKADQDSKIIEGFIAENTQVRENRTWWDSFVDGLNRLPRPLGWAMTVGLLAWPLFDVIGFASAMNAYSLVPEWVVALVISVWAFYFTGRLLTKDLKMGGPSKKQLEQVLAAQADIEALRKTDELPEAEYQRELKDTSKPMSLESIKLWNEKRRLSEKKPTPR